MKFNDQGIIINKRDYSENSSIIKIFSTSHGLFSGFIASAKSLKKSAIIQIGNLVSFEWRSRTEEGLGQFFTIDLIKSFFSRIIFDPKKLICLNSILSIIDSNFLERENQTDLFYSLTAFLEELADDNSTKKEYLASYIKLELEILQILGYGLDLSCCVVTNKTDNLSFVSPKSARAVSFEAGKQYQDKLLKLPNFLINPNSDYDENQLLEGFKLTGHFIQKYIFDSHSNAANEVFSRIRSKVQSLCVKNPQE
jgi:DNA repair protein RecO (recombination protein O)